MIKYLQFGFSLIELMVVIAIVSILATIAIPSYQNYALRARFAEVISATEPFKIAISLALQQNIPESELTNGIHNIPSSPIPTQNLAHIKVENGIIFATATHKANDLTYILKPDAKGNSWQIEGSCIAAEICEPK